MIRLMTMYIRCADATGHGARPGAASDWFATHGVHKARYTLTPFYGGAILTILPLPRTSRREGAAA